MVYCWVIGYFVWILQKVENKIKVVLDLEKVDQMIEVLGMIFQGVGEVVVQVIGEQVFLWVVVLEMVFFFVDLIWILENLQKRKEYRDYDFSLNFEQL